MALYVRVFNSFYNHRKTLRLSAVIGNDAFWIPPRLWAYAAESQPDGEFSNYSPSEIAKLIGYLGDPQALLQALLQAGFLDRDPLRIHDWHEHNSYHSSYADRARKANEARWAKHREEEEERKRKDIERKGKEASIALSNASSIELASEIYECYPRKAKRPKAIQAILKALKTVPSDTLRERTIAYATAMFGSEPRFIPHPATWFNAEQYNDPPENWRNDGRIIANHTEGF